MTLELQVLSNALTITPLGHTTAIMFVCIFVLIQFGICLNAAGADAQSVARLAGIGLGEKALAFDLPIMSRFRLHVFTHK